MNLQERLADIKAKIDSFRALEKPSTEQVTEAKALAAEYKDVAARIELDEELNGISAIENKASGRKTAPGAAGAEAKKEDNGGFTSMKDFLKAVKSTSLTGQTDPRFSNTMFEKNGEDGGFLVPETMATDVQKVLTSPESLMSLTRIFRVSSNNLTLPIDESTPWTNGVKAFWIEEGGLYQDTKPKFTMVQFRLHKLGVLIKITDELLEDAVALESYIRNSAPDAIMHEVNKAIIEGNGVGKPKGILASAFTVVVPADAGQAADTITARNLINMYSHMLPTSRTKAVWLIHPSAEAALRLVKDDNDNFIYLSPGSQLNQSPYGTLLGARVIPMMSALNPIGDVGDIIFADLSYYWTILKTSGMKQAVSTHLYFDRDITAYKFTLRIDGKVPFEKPVVSEKGNYAMSAFVVLAAR